MQRMFVFWTRGETEIVFRKLKLNGHFLINIVLSPNFFYEFVFIKSASLLGE